MRLLLLARPVVGTPSSTSDKHEHEHEGKRDPVPDSVPLEVGTSGSFDNTMPAAARIGGEFGGHGPLGSAEWGRLSL